MRQGRGFESGSWFLRDVGSVHILVSRDVGLSPRLGL